MESILGAIIVALITGGLSLVGVIITNASSNKQIENQLVTAQMVTDVKLDKLTEEVKKHNAFAERIPVIETRLDRVEGDIKSLKEELHEQ